MHLPDIDHIVLENIFELCTTSSHHDIGSTSRRQPAAFNIGVVQEIYPVDNDALLGGGLAFQHAGAVGDAAMVLDDGITGARCYVVAVAPDGRSRVVRKQFAPELIAVIWAEGIGSLAYGVTHRVRLIGLIGNTLEERHHNEPAVGQLVIAHDSVAIIPSFARAAEAFKDGVGRHGAVQHPTGAFEKAPLL